MNSLWLFLLPAVCGCASLSGLAFLLAAWFVCRRKGPRRRPVPDDSTKPPKIQNRDASPLESVLKQSHQELFRDNDQTSIGMNWLRARKDAGKQVVVWHNGGTGRFCSFLGFTEDGHSGVVLLSNSTCDVDGLGWQLLGELAKAEGESSFPRGPANFFCRE